MQLLMLSGNANMWGQAVANSADPAAKWERKRTHTLTCFLSLVQRTPVILMDAMNIYQLAPPTVDGVNARTPPTFDGVNTRTFPHNHDG